MNKLLSIFIIILFVSCVEKQNTPETLSAEMNTISDWFSAWELVKDEIYNLKTYEPVDFVFFDDTYVYSTSTVTIANGLEIAGPSLLNENLVWKKKEHKDSITLPTGEVVPLGLMVFASPLEKGKKESFFVMPLPDFWKNAGVKSELPYPLFLSGIFLHEFSHTQQMRGIGARITQLAENFEFKEELNDEIVEQLFSGDSAYVSMFELEYSKVFKAVEEVNTESRLILTQEILSSIKKREDKFFVADYTELAELNDLFLTMEGVGQLTMYEWLIHPKGGNISKNRAFNGARTKSWVQDEGFGLALLLSTFKSPAIWGRNVFGENSKTLTELIAMEIEGEL